MAICIQVKDGDLIKPLDDAIREGVLEFTSNLNNDGLRVIAVAYKEVPRQHEPYSIADESALTLVGLIAFLDPPRNQRLRRSRTSIAAVWPSRCSPVTIK